MSKLRKKQPSLVLQQKSAFYKNLVDLRIQNVKFENCKLLFSGKVNKEVTAIGIKFLDKNQKEIHFDKEYNFNGILTEEGNFTMYLNLYSNDFDTILIYPCSPDPKNRIIKEIEWQTYTIH